jgi:hypothetical protein
MMKRASGKIEVMRVTGAEKCHLLLNRKNQTSNIEHRTFNEIPLNPKTSSPRPSPPLGEERETKSRSLLRLRSEIAKRGLAFAFDCARDGLTEGGSPHPSLWREARLRNAFALGVMATA